MNIKWYLTPCLFFLFSSLVFASNSMEEKKKEISQVLHQLYTTRTNLLINQEPETIASFYNDEKTSRYAFSLEVRRSQYINSWASSRNIILTDAKSKLKITNIKFEGETAKISLIHSQSLSYLYQYKNFPEQKFGVGTRHTLTLKKAAGKWTILREWYTDPMEENPNNIPSKDETKHLRSSFFSDNEKASTVARIKRYDRKRAVQYANKFAGAAWGAGNNNSYNKKYHDFTYNGGDCTNFASQVIGDPEAGGLPMQQNWFYRKNVGGSESWVRTDSFKDFLLYGGYGSLIAYGDFSDVTKPTKKYPKGAIGALQPGDLIGYEMKGDVDHFSVAVARDDNGYVLVNSHTGDRYHVPWDIGWDKFTRFWLIHIND